MNLKNRIIALVAATSIAVPAIAVAKHAVKGGTTAEVKFKGKLNDNFAAKVASKIAGPLEGTSNDVKVEDDDTTVTIRVGLGAIKTGNTDRDGHFQQRVAVKDHKTATLKVKKDQIKGKEGGTADAELTIRGTTKPVKVNWSAKPEGDGLKVTGSFNIKYTDFFDGHKDEDERRVCQFNVCVEPDIAVNASFSVTK
jgi:polyisoprenoid-binding protein YceI